MIHHAANLSACSNVLGTNLSDSNFGADASVIKPNPLVNKLDVIHYNGGEELKGIPNRNDIVAENDAEGLTAVLEDALSKQQDIPFMAVDLEGSSVKIDGKYYYILR